MIPWKDAILLLCIYFMAALLLTAIGYRFFRYSQGATMAAFLLMCFHFFFGSVQDALRHQFPGSLLPRYSFLLPVSMALLASLFVWLRKKKPALQKMTAYLNLLMLILILADAGGLPDQIHRKEIVSVGPLAACDSCGRPDIYLIILDEYAGQFTLKKQFGYDNVAFEAALKERGFHIVADSRSNYNYTPFSMASMLNMEYLELNVATRGSGNLAYCYQKIQQSSVLRYLQQLGYELYNFSIFDFPGQPADAHDSFLPRSTKLITAQTFLPRVIDDIGFNVSTGKINFRPLQQINKYKNLHNNKYFIEQTIITAAKATALPKFVYTHLLLPHYPYYFDREGKPVTIDKILRDDGSNRNDYVEYLQYGNREILRLVDYIFSHASQPPIIFLMGDHGFRHFDQPVQESYYFLNLNAVYFPKKDYGQFYTGMTAVNQFRAFFNTQFGSSFPMLPDSTIFLWK